MTLKHKLLTVAAMVVAVSMACSGLDTSPAATVTPQSVPTPTPTQGGGPSQPGDLETVTVAQVVDGDTIELANGRRVRYIGINTPERDQPFYNEATEINRQLVGGKEVQLEFDVETFDQYGRSLAYVWVKGIMANLEIVNQGFANAFTVPPNVRYEKQFRETEREAREAERGLWAGSDVALKITHIEANAPGNDNENPNGEWVEITNQGGEPVPMQGYTLKDEANHLYTFGEFAVESGTAFRIYSGRGQDNPEALYWGLVDESVWNNGADTAFLRDDQGNLVDTYAY